MSYIDMLLPLIIGAAEVSTALTKSKKKTLPKKQGSSPAKEITDNEAYDQINKKPQASIIKWMMDQANIDIPCLAKYLNCQPQSLRNKFNRDSFSIDDLVITAYACGYDLILNKEESENHEEERRINPQTYLSSRDDSSWDRIYNLKKQNYSEKLAEYKELKERLAKLNKEYQFEQDN